MVQIVSSSWRRRSAAPDGPRVAMFVNALARGGAETQFLRVAGALRRAGYNVRIYTLLDHNDFAEELDGLPVSLLAARPGPATVRNAIGELRAWRPDAVLSFLYQATIVGRIAALGARTPVVVSSMRNERLETRVRTLLYRSTGVGDAAIVTNSELAASTLRREGTVTPSKLRVIPNGVDLGLFDVEPEHAQRLRTELGIAADTFLYLGVGRLAPQKDWPTLVSAVSRYTGPKAVWAIAGEGEGHDALRSQIDSAGLADQVLLLGLRDDIPALLAAGDGLVLSSTYEGLPNVVLEAMASGVPVVATRVGGCAELLGTRFGLLVEPRDPDALAAAMAELATRGVSQRRDAGAAAQEHVRSHYALESADRQWVGLLDDLLAAQGVPRSRREADPAQRELDEVSE